MCGRFSLHSPPEILQAKFGADTRFEAVPRYNIAPSQVVQLVRQDEAGHRQVIRAAWGLVPSWVKDPAAIQHPINAKAETVAIKPMFRHAFRKSRILVPTDGFYEWKSAAGGKQPYLIRMRDHSPFGIAGLLEHWVGPSGTMHTFTILTTEPNPLMAEIHNRMPVIIRPEDYGRWLDPVLIDVSELQPMIGPFPERLMEAYPVSKKVNNPANDTPECLDNT